MWKYSRFLLEKAVKAGLYSSSKFNTIAGSEPITGGDPRAWRQSQIKSVMRAAGVTFPRKEKVKIVSEEGEDIGNELKEKPNVVEELR